MNYRHQFHAGNFADVMKHALLVQLVRALQRKEKGFLYLDTHAGRGGYDLAQAARGDTLERAPEWPDGIGRLWAAEALPPMLADYVALVREFDRGRGNLEARPRFYPGSPWIVHHLARPQERLVLCEAHAAECAALDAMLGGQRNVTVRESDGYAAPRALLPPPERRALVLIDPPFEAQDEFKDMTKALRAGVRRLPGGVFSLWYPLTERARVDAFFAELTAEPLPPSVAIELTVDSGAARMKGCGLVIINPPWQLVEQTTAGMKRLAELLGRREGAEARALWLVPER